MEQITNIRGVTKNSPVEHIVSQIQKTGEHLEMHLGGYHIFNEPIANIKKAIADLVDVVERMPKDKVPLNEKWNLNTSEGLRGFVSHNSHIAKKMLWRILYELHKMNTFARKSVFDENYFGLVFLDIQIFINLFDEDLVYQELDD